MDHGTLLVRYAALAERVLRTLCAALERAGAAAVPGLSVVAERRDVGASVVLDPAVLIVSRAPDANSRWTLRVGFAAADFDLDPEHTPSFGEAIDDTVPSGDPPLRIPVFATWEGSNRFGRPVRQVVDLGPIVVTPSGGSWGNRHWSGLDDAVADRIAGAILRRSVAHETPAAAAAALPGARWERVRGVARPQQGGQGSVWKVRDRTAPEAGDFALKELRYAKSRTSVAYRRFCTEVETTRALQHPNVVPVVDAWVPEDDALEDAPYYVMPWAERTLARAKDYRGNVQRVLEVGVALASALAAAHAVGVVHRDVKPANVLLTADGTPWLADFGICYLQTDDEDRRVTRTLGNTVGSDDYVAPELRGGRLDDVDGRVDVYSLGKTLYAALAGGDPFPLERLDDPRYDLRVAIGGPAVDHFYGVLARMVAADRDARFPTMDACRDALARALDNVLRFAPYRAGMYAGSNVTSAVGAALVVALKRHLGDPAGPIAAHDFVLTEASAVQAAAFQDVARLNGAPVSAEAVREHLAQLDVRGVPLAYLMATGCYWAAASHDRTWPRALARAADVDRATITSPGGSWAWTSLRYYPAMLALYGGGIAATEAGRWDVVAALLQQSVTWISSAPAAYHLNPSQVMSTELQGEVLGRENLLTPLSEHVYRVLGDPLRDLFAEAAAYGPAFDWWEYLVALVCADGALQAPPDAAKPNIPLGRFRRYFTGAGIAVAVHDTIGDEIAAELDAAGPKWGPLQGGLFGGSPDSVRRALVAVRERARAPQA